MNMSLDKTIDKWGVIDKGRKDQRIKILLTTKIISKSKILDKK